MSIDLADVVIEFLRRQLMRNQGRDNKAGKQRNADRPMQLQCSTSFTGSPIPYF